MSGSVKLALTLFAALLALFFVAKIVHFVLGLFSLLVPVLAIAGVGVLVFAVVNRKGLGMGRRRILP